MKLDYLFICIAFSVLSLIACDDNPVKSTMTAFGKGKSYLADADRIRESKDEMQAKKFYQKAIVEFENEVRVDANKPELALMLGIAQYRVRDFDNAIQWLTKATKQDKSDPVAFQYLGYCYVNKSKIDEAMTAFRSAFSNNTSGVIKGECIEELMEIGELSMTIGNNFIQQGNSPQGYSYKKLGMRIMAMGLEFSKYDLDLAKKIQVFAVDMKDQILMDWIANVIENDGNTVQEITIPVRQN